MPARFRHHSLPALLAMGFLCSRTGSSQALHTQALNDGWRFRAVAAPQHLEALDWHPATVPGVVQTDLRIDKLIDDPFLGDNEKRLQWIGDTDWEYATTFTADASTLRQHHIELVFDGLDTLADISLNGALLLHADNQFRTWRLDVAGKLLPGNNTLKIVFHSPVTTLAPITAKLPYIVPGPGYETLDRAKGIYPTSQFVRKAGYAFGWDWGPRFVTAGIWKPVHLDSWSGRRITALHLQQNSVTEARALTEATVDVLSDTAGPATVEVTAVAPDGTSLTRRLPVILDAGANHLSVPLRIEHPQRWFPNGYGPQSRYRIEARLLVAGRAAGKASIRTGLRSLELRREPDTWGKSFTFVVNGIPIFAKGANLVPLDSFAPSVTPQRKRATLAAARDGNMNMLRIWGGGYYESDDFYDDADEFGILIWHDFMFGGGMIPDDPAFQRNVQAEATEQVERLSDHPSMALWCGNNELETAWNAWGDRKTFQKEITPQQRELVWQNYLLVFRDILKSTVAQHGNGVPYWSSSPSADFEDIAGNNHNGDVHSWSVWSAGAPIAEYAQSTPRFLSEFGFQAMPDLRTVRAFAGSNEDLSSPALKNHERFIHGYDRMQTYLKGEFREPRDFPSFVYLSQVMQGEAIKVAVEHLRASRPQNMGTLYWQLNDCWPVASWASLDYFNRWKGLHFYARRFYAPLLITAEVKGLKAHIVAVSDETKPRSLTASVTVLRFDGTVLSQQKFPLQLSPLSATAVTDLDLSKTPGFTPTTSFLHITLDDTGGPSLATNTVFFAPNRELALPKTTITHTLQHDASGQLTLTLQSPVLARVVQLSFGDLDVQPADNFFDLLPGETRQIALRTSATEASVASALTLRSVQEATR